METKNIIKQYLISLADEKYKKFQQKLCPGINNMLGIRLPILKKYAKHLYKEYSFEYLISQIDNEFYEEIMLQGLLIGLHETDIKLLLPYIDDFILKIDNWATCDTFCSSLKITKKYRDEMWIFLQKFFLSSKEFEIRFGIVMILTYYLEEKYLSQIFDIFSSIKNDRYYVQMSIAWALSFCFIKYYDQTKKFIIKNLLTKYTHNKAIQKSIESLQITTNQKEELRLLKRK